jgi:hypothetical protein
MLKPDLEDESFKIEGGLMMPESTSPVLCLFPTIYFEALPDQNIKSCVLRFGKGMFRDSPPRVIALTEEADFYSALSFSQGVEVILLADKKQRATQADFLLVGRSTTRLVAHSPFEAALKACTTPCKVPHYRFLLVL